MASSVRKTTTCGGAHFGETLPPTGAGSDATVTEVDTVAVNTTSTLALSEAAHLDVPIHYDTAEISAAAGSDNTLKSGGSILSYQTNRRFAGRGLGR